MDRPHSVKFLKRKRFRPCNVWKIDAAGVKWTNFENIREPRFLIDVSTNDNYLNESNGSIRFKALLLTFSTPIIHSLETIWNATSSVLNALSFAHLWLEREGEASYNFKARLVDWGKDILHIVLAPISFVGLQLAAIYALISPNNGRKLYATFEYAIYKRSLLAPCFQPDPKSHLFGGDINKKDSM